MIIKLEFWALIKKTLIKLSRFPWAVFLKQKGMESFRP